MKIEEKRQIKKNKNNNNNNNKQRREKKICYMNFWFCRRRLDRDGVGVNVWHGK